jgi:branched-chain amino acid transport system substrate-binding protein
VLSAASKSPSLQGVKWYGSDSVAQSKELVEDKTAAAFAVAAGYPNAILGVSDSDRALWQPVGDKVKQKIGRAPDAFAFASYDALTVGYRALTKSNTTDAGALKKALTEIAAGYHGLTGQTDLNAAGDRATTNYDFWSVCAKAGQFTWVRTIAYTSAPGKPGQVTRPESC